MTGIYEIFKQKPPNTDQQKLLAFTKRITRNHVHPTVERGIWEETLIYESRDRHNERDLRV